MKISKKKQKEANEAIADKPFAWTERDDTLRTGRGISIDFEKERILVRTDKNRIGRFDIKEVLF